jgi:hypothetical protein
MMPQGECFSITLLSGLYLEGPGLRVFIPLSFFVVLKVNSGPLLDAVLSIEYYPGPGTSSLI